jgi:hypothetical protein
MFNCGQPWLPHVTPYPNAEYAEALLTIDIRDAGSLTELLKNAIRNLLYKTHVLCGLLIKQT